MAAAIEQQNPGSLDEKSALIGEHVEAAGDLHAAFDWHMRAGAWSNNRDIAAARVSWDRARQVADALPDDDPDRTAMRIAPRTILCATGWRVHANDSHVRFEELRELCTLAGDKTSLAIGIAGPIQVHYERGEIQQASRLASEQLALLESIGDPSLTAQAGFSAMGIKAQIGELVEALRWSQATIDWAGGDLTKGGLIIGSPLAWAKLVRGTAGWWFGRRGWREDLDEAFAMAESADAMTLALRPLVDLYRNDERGPPCRRCRGGEDREDPPDGPGVRGRLRRCNDQERPGPRALVERAMPQMVTADSNWWLRSATCASPAVSANGTCAQST